MTIPSNLFYIIHAIFSGQTSQKNVIQLCHCHVQVYKQDWYIEGKHRIYCLRRALVSLTIRCVPSHINYIFTINTPIHIYPAIKFAKMLFNLIIKKKITETPLIP
jgi:hypothetical protein